MVGQTGNAMDGRASGRHMVMWLCRRAEVRPRDAQEMSDLRCKNCLLFWFLPAPPSDCGALQTRGGPRTSFAENACLRHAAPHSESTLAHAGTRCPL